MTKADWLEKGKELGASASRSAWDVGRWLVEGEDQFLPKMPGSKRARRAYYRDRKAHWMALFDEASAASGLAASSLRQYANVWRRRTYTVFPDLKFGHHLEVMRCHTIDDDGKRSFDFGSAVGILSAAAENGWSVIQTRAEVSRRYPLPKTAQNAMYKIRRIIDSVTGEQRDELLAALAEELASRRPPPTSPPDEFTDTPY